jgi:hypothetical protein
VFAVADLEDKQADDDDGSHFEISYVCF